MAGIAVGSFSCLCSLWGPAASRTLRFNACSATKRSMFCGSMCVVRRRKFVICAMPTHGSCDAAATIVKMVQSHKPEMGQSDLDERGGVRSWMGLRQEPSLSGKKLYRGVWK